MAEVAAAPDEEITLIIRIEGEMAITVNRAEYEAAKAAGQVDHFLDHDLSDFDGHNIVVEPDGRSYNPHEQPHGPRLPIRRRPKWLGKYEKWPCDRCGQNVNAVDPHPCTDNPKCGNPHNCTCKHGCDIP